VRQIGRGRGNDVVFAAFMLVVRKCRQAGKVRSIVVTEDQGAICALIVIRVLISN